MDEVQGQAGPSPFELPIADPQNSVKVTSDSAKGALTVGLLLLLLCALSCSALCGCLPVLLRSLLSSPPWLAWLLRTPLCAVPLGLLALSWVRCGSLLHSIDEATSHCLLSLSCDCKSFVF